MYIKCSCCRGQKKIKGLGNIEKECPECKGIGHVSDVVKTDDKKDYKVAVKSFIEGTDSILARKEERLEPIKTEIKKRLRRVVKQKAVSVDEVM